MSIPPSSLFHSINQSGFQSVILHHFVCFVNIRPHENSTTIGASPCKKTAMPLRRQWLFLPRKKNTSKFSARGLVPWCPGNQSWRGVKREFLYDKTHGVQNAHVKKVKFSVKWHKKVAIPNNENIKSTKRHHENKSTMNWVWPPPSNSDHRNYSIFRLGVSYKPSFATGILGGGNPPKSWIMSHGWKNSIQEPHPSFFLRKKLAPSPGNTCRFFPQLFVNGVGKNDGQNAGPKMVS